MEFGDGIKAIPANLFLDCDGLKSVAIPDTVTIIHDGAFNNCSNLKSVSFGESITSIEADAFQSTALEEAILPEGLLKLGENSFGNTFSNCKSLKKVYIPSTLEECGWPDGDFSGCSALEEVEFGEDIMSIPANIFLGCDGLKKIVIPDTVETIGSGAFDSSSIQEMTIPDSVQSYGGSLFSGCTSLTTVTLSANALDIPDSMFKGCTALETIALPEGVTEIKSDTFQDCEKLKSITLPTGVTTIGMRAFEGCSALKNIDFLPYTVNFIDSYAFRSCTGLETADIPDLVTEIGSYSFTGCENLSKVILSADLKTIGTNAFENDSKLSEVYFNPGLQRINNSVFKNCALKEINLPDSVTTLEAYVFAGNSKLTSVKLSSGLKEIPSYAFADCDNKQFTSLVIPTGITKISEYAFYNDIYLLEFTIPASVAEIGSNAFSYIRRTTINGVSGSYAENWSSVKWKAFNDISKPAEEIHLASGKDELTIPSAVFKPRFTILPEDTSDFVVKLESADTNIVKVEDNTTLCGWNQGETTVTATTYHGQTYTFTVCVSDVNRYEVSAVPNKQKLSLKENKDTTGLVINAVFANGVREEFYDYALVGYTTDVKGEHEVTVQTIETFPSKLTSFSIFVDTDISGTIGENDEVTWTDIEGNPEKIHIDGPVSTGEPVIVASYDQNGKLIDADIVTVSDTDTHLQASSKLVKIMWLDNVILPKCKNAKLIK